MAQSKTPKELLSQCTIEQMNCEAEKTLTRFREGDDGSMNPQLLLSRFPGFKVSWDGVVEEYYGSDCDVEIPISASEIGPNAFLGCSHLRSVIIHDNITVIGDRAFYGCSSLEKVVLPNTVRSIGNYAFFNCPKLESVFYRGNELTQVGVNPFATEWIKKQSGAVAVNGILLGYILKQTDIPVLKIPSGIRVISEAAMFFPEEEAERVQTLILPDSLHTISRDAFRQFTNLRTVDLGAGVRRISDYSFDCCSQSLSFLHGESVEFTGYYALGCNPSLQGGSGALQRFETDYTVQGRRFLIQEGISEIEGLHFYNADIDVVYIPGSVESIYNTTFEPGVHIETPFWSYAHHYAERNAIPVDARLENTKHFRPFWPFRTIDVLLQKERFDCVERIITAGPDYWMDCRLHDLISKCSNLKEFRSDFRFCSELVADNGVLYSDYGASLVSVAPRASGTLKLREGVDDLRMYSVSNTDVAEVVLPETVTAIEESAFSNCPNLRKLFIPASVSSIGDQLDCDSPVELCPSLERFDVSPDNGRYFALDGVLYSARNNTLLSYPGGKDGPFETPDFVKDYAFNAFYGCKGLTSITVSPNVTKIYETVFRDCTSLRSILLPRSVAEIDLYAFEGCSALTDIFLMNPYAEFKDMDRHVVTLTGTQRTTVHVEMGPAARQIAENCLFDLDVSIRDTEELCHHALYNWDSLIRLQLPDNLKTIGQSALEGCTSLKEVTIPKSVSAIGQDAFLGCDKLHLRVHQNSYAEVYAENCGIPYSYVDA